MELFTRTPVAMITIAQTDYASCTPRQGMIPDQNTHAAYRHAMTKWVDHVRTANLSTPHSSWVGVEIPRLRNTTFLSNLSTPHPPWVGVEIHRLRNTTFLRPTLRVTKGPSVPSSDQIPLRTSPQEADARNATSSLTAVNAKALAGIAPQTPKTTQVATVSPTLGGGATLPRAARGP